MFALLFLHNAFNRRWYGTLPNTWRGAKPLVTAVLNLTLLVAIVTLLTTSVLISQSLFGFLAFGGATALQIHVLAAYWALVIISIHLGLHWSIVMNVVRSLVGIRQHSAVRTLFLRLVALGVAAHGLYSSLEVDIGSKLFLVPTMQFWDFSEDTLGFFLHHASIVGLYACVGHYVMVALQAWIKHSRAMRYQASDAAAPFVAGRDTARADSCSSSYFLIDASSNPTTQKET